MLSAKNVIIQSDILFRPKDSSVVTAVLINNAVNSRCRALPYKMQYLQAQIPQPKMRSMHTMKTGVLKPHTQYIKPEANIVPSVSTKNINTSTKSVKNKTPRRKKQFLKKVSSIPAVPPNDIFDSDLSTCSFDTTHDTDEATTVTTHRHTQSVNGAKQLTNGNFNVKTTVDDLPTLLINSNVDCVAASQYSDSQYPQNGQYLQPQVPQSVQYLQSLVPQNENNCEPIAVSTCPDIGQGTYIDTDIDLKPNTEVDSTLNTSNMVYATENAVSGNQNEEQIQKTEYSATTAARVLPSNIFDSNIFTCSFDDIIDSDCSSSQYTTESLEVPQKETVLTTEISTSKDGEYIKSAIEFTPLTNVISEEPIKIECSTAQYTAQCLQSEIPQEKTFILTTATPTSGSTHYMNTDVFTSTLNSVTADQSVKIECATPEYTKQCLQAQAPQEETYVLTTETPTSATAEYVDPDIFTSTLNTITANQPIKIECSTPQYTTQCLEAQVPQEETYVLATETSTSGSAQYVHPDVFTSTLNSIITDQPMDIAYSTSEYGTQSLQAQIPQAETYLLTTDTSTFEHSNNADQTATKKTVFTAPLPPPQKNKKKPTATMKTEFSTSQYSTQCLPPQVSQEKSYLTTEKSNPGSVTFIEPDLFTSTMDTATSDKPLKVECDRVTQKRAPCWKSPGVSDDIAQINIKKAAFATPLPPVVTKKKKPPTPTNTSLKFEFHRSSHGNKLLILNGIKYRMVSAGLDKIRWRCASHERFGCKAVVHTLEKHIIYMTDNHVTSSKKTKSKINPKV